MTITTHLLQSTACVAIAAILALALKRAPARTRYGIWLFASLKFLVPLSLFTVAGTYFSTWTPTLTTPTVSVAMRWLDRSLLVWSFDEAATGGSAGFPGDVNRLALVTLVAFWATGFVSLTIWRWRQWRELTLLARALPPIEEGRESEALARVTRMVARPVRIQLLRCDGSIEPGVLGAVHPKLLWPHGLSDRLSDAELESLLAHEACHVSRRDNLTALIQVVVETVFWFHPVVWWVGSQLVSERERACDEEVLQMGADNRSYAEAILKVCGFGFRAPVAFMAGITGSRLAERIEWILDRQFASTPTLSTRLLLGGIVAATLAVPLAAGALSSHREPTGEGTAAAACDVTIPVAERPPDDPNASPSVLDWYANADRTMWASGGSPVPGTLRTKVLWVRPAGATLQISARRLDGDAGPISVTIPSGYATTIQASGLTFSSPGCWQVTGTAGGRSLQFILHLAEPARSAATNTTPSISASPGQDSQHPAFDCESPCQVNQPQAFDLAESRPGRPIPLPHLSRTLLRFTSRVGASPTRGS